MKNNVILCQEQLVNIKCLYDSILEISIQQKDLLEQGTEDTWAMDKLIELMTQREEIIRRIDELGPLNVPPHDIQQNGSSRTNEQQSSDHEQYYQQNVEQIRKTILDIQAVDLSCKAKMEDGMQRISIKLSQTRENKKAQLAYDQGDVYNSAWFFDKKQ